MSSWSLNKKFVLILTVLSLSIIAISSFGVVKLKQIAADFEEVTQVKLKNVGYSYDLKVHRAKIVSSQKDMLLAETPLEIENAAKEIENFTAEYLEALTKLEAGAESDNKAEVAEIRPLFMDFIKDGKTVHSLVVDHKEKEARALLAGKMAGTATKLGAITTALLSKTSKSMNELTAQSDQSVKSTILFFTLLGFGSLALSLSLSFFILKAINATISDVISRLADNSIQVASASSQIASAATQLSASTTEQAAALQQTTASVEELSSMTQKNTESATQTAKLSTASQGSSENGQRIVAEMLMAIQEIHQSNSAIMIQTNESNQQFSEIVKIISEIGTKTKVINDIVFQTKLLSFNASVEAARAGEHGKGFAVVAEEVGNLAQMSGNAAKEISGMLDDSAGRVNSIVVDNKQKIERLLAQAAEKVESGTRVAKQCEEVLNEIGISSREVNTMAVSIAGASEEQSQGIGEITKAMNQLDQVTQQNSSVTAEASSAADALAQQADDLKSVVAELAQAILGGSAQSHRNKHNDAAEASHHGKTGRGQKLFSTASEATDEHKKFRSAS